MVAFFPTLFPDELLYSGLARYHIRMGNVNNRTIQRELYGQPPAASVDLPSSIDSLMKGIPSESGYTTEYIILNHTLFPYYAPFLSPERSLKLMNFMKNSRTKGLHSVANVNSNPQPDFIRYCPECYLKERKIYGEAYWHRTHQLPGVLFCSEHNILLSDSYVQFRRHNRFDYIAPSDSNCNAAVRRISYSRETLEKLALHAIDCKWLLNNNQEAHSLNWYRDTYRELLSNKDLASFTGKMMNEGKLHKEFLDFYGREVLNLWKIDVEKPKQLNKVVWTLDRPVSSHVHLLMIRFLVGSPIDFFQCSHAIKPFGMPAWPCLNPVCGHYLKSVIAYVEITSCTNTNRPLGQFTCEHCGFTYTRRGPDRNDTDRLQLTSVRTLGELWTKKAKKIANAKNINISEQKKKSWMFKIVIENLSVLPYWYKGKKTQMVFKDFYNSRMTKIEFQKAEKRRLWLSHVESNPNFNRSQLQEKEAGLSVWLIRYDYDWFNQNTPVRTWSKIRSLTDRTKQDIEVLAKLQLTVHDLLTSKEKPKRLTMWRIGKMTGTWALLDKQLENLPQCKSFLDLILEGRDDYNIRKVKWAALELNLRNEEVKAWRIIRVAGISRSISQLVAQEIEKQVCFYS